MFRIGIVIGRGQVNLEKLYIYFIKILYMKYFWYILELSQEYRGLSRLLRNIYYIEVILGE